MEELKSSNEVGKSYAMSTILVITGVVASLILVHTDIVSWVYHGAKAQIEIERDIFHILVIFMMFCVFFFLSMIYSKYGNKGLAWGITILIVISLLFRPAIRGFYFNYYDNNRPYRQIVYSEFYSDRIFQREHGASEEDYAELLFEFSLREDDLEYWFETKRSELY